MTRTHRFRWQNGVSSFHICGLLYDCVEPGIWLDDHCRSNVELP